MSRDHRKLAVFGLADSFVVSVYACTGKFPPTEHFGLQAQIRRSAVSIAANIVEGCARPSLGEYRRFVGIALASARECSYLLGLATRLGFIGSTDGNALLTESEELMRRLGALARALDSRTDG